MLDSATSFNSRRDALARNPEVTTDRLANSAFGELQQRLAAGDARATDSVFQVWLATRDALERQRILSYGSGYGRAGGAALAARINDALRTAVDSNAIVNALLARPREWSVAAVRDVLIPYMAEPGGALAHGR